MGDKLRAHWNARFSENAPEALSWYQKDAGVSLDLLARFAPDPVTGLIDVGAGNGRLVDALLARGGRDLSLLDLSEAALEQTRARLGERAAEVEFLTGDLRDWAPPRRWAIWHDRAVFHFMVGAAERAAYLAALEQGTAPGALVLLATFSPDGPERCSGLPVARYSAEELARCLGPGYELLHGETRDHLTPSGAAQNFTHAVFRKA